MIGQRLKVARAASGMSLRKLEGKIGNRVTAQAIGKYERNESMPSSGVLIALADALGVSENYLFGNPEMVLEALEFKNKTIPSKREEAQIQAKVVHMLERYLMVEELLGLPSVEWDRPREIRYPVNFDVSEADRAAGSLRQYWDLGNDPIPDLVELLEERGIKVLAADLKNIDGLTARVRRARKGAIPVIVINRQARGEQQRFTLAHELGHLVMDVSARMKQEKAAHRFAGAFLMPADALWSEIGKHRTSISGIELFFLQSLFGVSAPAIIYRCRNLGIIKQSLFKHLLKEVCRPEQHRSLCKPYTPSNWESPRFERLTFRALSEGVISESKAAELLGISVRELCRHMELDMLYGPEAIDA